MKRENFKLAAGGISTAGNPVAAPTPARPLTLLERIRATYPGAGGAGRAGVVDHVSTSAPAPTTPAGARTLPLAKSANDKGPATVPPQPVADSRKPSPFVTAVWAPGDGWAFADHLTQADRREAVDTLEWFERVDARAARVMDDASTKSPPCGEEATE